MTLTCITAPRTGRAPSAPHDDGPPGRRAGLAIAALAVASAGVLAGCGGSSSSVSCSGSDCRATVTGAPVEVSQPDPGSGSVRRSGTRSTSRKPRNTGDQVDFTVAAIGPAWVDIDDDGQVTRVPVGQTFPEDGSVVRLESSDGRTAVLTFRKR